MNKWNVWWTLRDIWHRPQVRRYTVPEGLAFYWEEMPNGYRWNWNHAWHLYTHHPWYAWRDMKRIAKWLWWNLLWLQPFRCNGYKGGWRTRLCEWLEDNARDLDDKRLEEARRRQA